MRTTIYCDVRKEDTGQPPLGKHTRKSRDPTSRKKRDFRVSMRVRTMPGSFKDLTTPTPAPVL